MTDVYTKQFTPTDPRLGRHVRHDPRSRGFARPTAVDKSTWRNHSIRVYDPSPNPDQPNGCCTAVAKAVQLNAAGNRKRGVVFDMAWVQDTYAWETQNDPFPGQMPTDDTGSDGLTSCKAAQHKQVGGTYTWLFGGADEVVQAIIDGDVVSIGARWDNDMFIQDDQGRVHLGGGVAGGHQWSARGYWKTRDWVLGRCWWGDFRDFWIARSDLDALLHDDGDAHVQERV